MANEADNLSVDARPAAWLTCDEIAPGAWFARLWRLGRGDERGTPCEWRSGPHASRAACVEAFGVLAVAVGSVPDADLGVPEDVAGSLFPEVAAGREAEVA